VTSPPDEPTRRIPPQQPGRPADPGVEPYEDPTAKKVRTLQGWLAAVAVLAVVALGVAAWAIITASDESSGGASAARVDALDEQVDELSNDIDSIKEDVSNVQKDVDGKANSSTVDDLEGKVSSLESQVNDLDTSQSSDDVQALQDQVDQLSQDVEQLQQDQQTQTTP
jgi:outer membrane murein-binding lipoprotein Lpp